MTADRDAEVLVVGAGAAGCMAACAAAASDTSAHVVLLTDRAPGASNSAMAQGGLQVPLDDDGARERFVADVVRSARVELDAGLVRDFARGIAGCVADLEAWGLVLERDAAGALVRRGAGGLSDPRIVSAGDSIGPALMHVLHERVGALGVAVVPHTRVVSVVPAGGRVAVEARDPDGATRTLGARAVVAATGGATFRVARERGEPTTNPRNENHLLADELTALGLARVHDDFFQYQPFGIVSLATGAVGRCVPESIVNLPVRLLDRHGREVCDLRLDRLAVGDAMRRALAAGDGCAGASGAPGLRLTLSALDDDLLRARFPKLAALLARHDALGDDVLVRPFLHYQLGGFRVPLDGRTAVPGLFLAGEMTGGLHGRNRLMGNGITESLVRGRRAGLAAAAWARGGRARG